MARRASPGVFVGPVPEPQVAAAVTRAGGTLVHDPASADAVVWLDGDPATLRSVLSPKVKWVQLSSAGVDRWSDAGALDAERVWTSAGPAYAAIVAEHAMALILAAAKRLHASIRATSWADPAPVPLTGATIVLVGSGRIGQALLRLTAPFDVQAIAVNLSGTPVSGAGRTVAADELDTVIPSGDYIVITTPNTSATRHLIGVRQFELMRPDAWLINVARGAIVDTDALVRALTGGQIGGCALDTTDPEPLPDEHPLWRTPNTIVTPHVANPIRSAWQRYAGLVEENVARFIRDEPLAGVIDPDAGY